MVAAELHGQEPGTQDVRTAGGLAVVTDVPLAAGVR